MIAHAEDLGPRPAPKWHAAFRAMLPTVIQYAKALLRDLDPDTREDLVQECVPQCTRLPCDNGWYGLSCA